MKDNTTWDSYNNLLLGPDVDRIRKLVVRHDLYKMSLQVPGDIFELGVFKGVGVMYWLKLQQIFEPGSRKKVVGFDTFTSFASSLLDYEKQTAAAYVNESNYDGIEPRDLIALARDAGLDHRLELVQGDIKETAAKYVSENPGCRISLLHIDFDTYEGTMHALQSFYPIVSRGGIIVFDEYADRGWGESDAVDEFFQGTDVSINAIPFSNKPTAYMVKK